MHLRILRTRITDAQASLQESVLRLAEKHGVREEYEGALTPTHQQRPIQELFRLEALAAALKELVDMETETQPQEEHPSVQDMTIDELEQHIAGIDDSAEIERMFAEEQGRDNARKGALAVLQSRLEEVQSAEPEGDETGAMTAQGESDEPIAGPSAEDAEGE